MPMLLMFFGSFSFPILISDSNTRHIAEQSKLNFFNYCKSFERGLVKGCQNGDSRWYEFQMQYGSIG
ncbi:hypothetical protein ACSBR1_014409 [Camellia fascicularis]